MAMATGNACGAFCAGVARTRSCNSSMRAQGWASITIRWSRRKYKYERSTPHIFGYRARRLRARSNRLRRQSLKRAAKSVAENSSLQLQAHPSVPRRELHHGMAKGETTRHNAGPCRSISVWPRHRDAQFLGISLTSGVIVSASLFDQPISDQEEGARPFATPAHIRMSPETVAMAKVARWAHAMGGRCREAASPRHAPSDFERFTGWAARAHGSRHSCSSSLQRRTFGLAPWRGRLGGARLAIAMSLHVRGHGTARCSRGDFSHLVRATRSTIDSRA
jgi:hypothetical protein